MYIQHYIGFHCACKIHCKPCHNAMSCVSVICNMILFFRPQFQELSQFGSYETFCFYNNHMTTMFIQHYIRFHCEKSIAQCCVVCFTQYDSLLQTLIPRVEPASSRLLRRMVLLVWRGGWKGLRPIETDIRQNYWHYVNVKVVHPSTWTQSQKCRMGLFCFQCLLCSLVHTYIKQ